MTERNKKIVIVGKGASGKNFLLKRLESRGFRHLVSHTTREMRPGETDGVEYHFTDREGFDKMISEGKLIEFQTFNGNLYGSSVDEWEKSDVMILAPQGVGNIKTLGLRSGCFIIYIDVPYEVRKGRLEARGCCTPEDIEERLESDEKEFDGFTEYDLRVTDPEF